MRVPIPQGGSALRILSRHSPVLLRIGWLRLIARLLEREQIPKARIGDILFETAKPAYQEWLEHSGLGKQFTPFSQIIAHKFPREAEQFGLYSPKDNDLTELGHALAFADEIFKQGVTPFSWPAPLRYIGLWILLEADGDLILSLLRAWPGDNCLLEPLPLLANAARELHKRASDEEQHAILQDFEQRASSDDEQKAYESCLYPLAEPLRELGYLDREKQQGIQRKIYVLTERGQRLVNSLRSDSFGALDASALLSSALGRVFFQAEDMQRTEAASLDDLRRTLMVLPSTLLGGQQNETPLVPAVHLTQAFLIQEGGGKWIELDSVREMLKRLGKASKGKIGLKEGRVAREVNVFWESSEVLRDRRLWVIPAGSQPGGTYQPPSEPSEPRLNPLQKKRIQRWLQYLARLLEAPSLGSPDVFIVGGPVSWVDRLLKIASMETKFIGSKRAAKPLAPQESQGEQVPVGVYLLSRFRKHAKKKLKAFEPADALVERWKGIDDNPIHLLRAFLERTNKAIQGAELLEDVGRRLEERLFAEENEEKESDWEETRWLTLALLGDILEQHHLGKNDIVAWMRKLEQPIPTRSRLESFLRYLRKFGEDTPFRVEFSAEVPGEWVDFVFQQADSTLHHKDGSRSITLEALRESDEGEVRLASRGQLDVRIELPAQSPDLAKILAQGLAAGAFSRLRALVSTDLSSGFEGIVFPCNRMVVYRMSEEKECSQEESADGVPFGSPIQFQRKMAEPFTWEQSWTLPWLDRASIHDGPSARTKLARTFHWLTIAEQRGLSPAQRLGHVWVALEHLTVEKGDSDHGPSVAAMLADVGTLCRLEALAGVAVRELCAALRSGSAGIANERQAWESSLREHLGDDIWDKVVRRGESAARSIPDDAALRFLLSATVERLQQLEAAIDETSPYGASLVRFFACEILNQSSLDTWLHATRREIQSLVFHAYEVRNLLFHDGAIFHFKDGTMLEHLYVRLRLVIDAVVRRFAIMALDASREPSTNSIWAHLRLGIHTLLNETKQKGAGKKDKKIDSAQLLQAVLQPQLPLP